MKVSFVATREGAQPGKPGEYSSTLKQEVIDWLNENVKDSTDKIRKDMPQGWMIYDPMRVHQTTEVSVFFLRGSDAVAFKLRWS